MNVSIQIKLENSLLKKISKTGTFPDSLENILVMRVQDILRRIKILHGEIHNEIIRSEGTLFSLYQVNININGLNFDDAGKLDFTERLAQCFSPYKDQIKKVDMVIS